MIEESFLTTEEVLEYLQVNLRTVYRLIKAGKIPAIRVGRQWRFRKRDIDAWLESQRPRRGDSHEMQNIETVRSLDRFACRFIIRKLEGSLDQLRVLL